MYDLLYCGEHEQEIRAMVEKEFPDATIKNASDDIHRGRFSIEMDCNDDDWMLFVMRHGIHEISFEWQVLKMDDPDRLKPLIKQVVDEQRSGAG